MFANRWPRTGDLSRTARQNACILDAIRERKVDTVVLGSRGLGDVAGLLLGSVSHKVTHLAPCTCIVVR
ncbi:universal stress protein [Martelella soudanensis]|uniref:universal stress protein n=1 Tax=Martelella sp. NC20 TaxID=2740298 RepID=UPI0015DDBC51